MNTHNLESSFGRLQNEDEEDAADQRVAGWESSDLNRFPQVVLSEEDIESGIDGFPVPELEQTKDWLNLGEDYKNFPPAGDRGVGSTTNED